MKKGLLVGLIGLACLSCGKNGEELVMQEAPDENRFIREVLVSNLYEPTELEVLPDNRILFTQRRGAIKMYNPETEAFFMYDSIPVYLENEDGLMGMALDPNFEYNHWVYLYYSPPGKEEVQNLSRFSFTSKGLSNEIIILQVPVQRTECCHTGGSVQFGPGGLLYLSTGDNTNPFDSEGYSPSDEREGRSAWDAQRTSSNTNDLRGKILRIKPLPDGSYIIPEGNLFEDDDPLTRPEIYVMGCRNPYRIAVDPVRDWLFWGDVGPDANNDDKGRGPRGHDEFNVALKAGYYGWPLFVANNQAYYDYDYETEKSGSLFDPVKPINNSVNNTGLTELPPANPAKIYYPYDSYDLFPQVGSGGRNAMAGPVYYSDQYTGRQKFPSYLDGRVIFYDWIRDFVYFLKLDDSGNPVDWYPFMPNTEFSNIIDMEFGSDGNLYMIEYGNGWFTQNMDARLSRISYIKGNRPPVMKATLSKYKGAAPMEVVFDASGSKDYDGDQLAYKWSIGDSVFNDSTFTYTFSKEGVYYPEIILSDGNGNTVREQFVVEVGNEPPNVEVKISGNTSFFWKGRTIDYVVSVTDKEDEKLLGRIDQTSISFDISHFQSTDLAEAMGHQAPIKEGLSMIQSLDCKSCHKIEGKSIGPSYTAVAKKYTNRDINYLANKVINGGGGVWGEQAMSAHPDLEPEDANVIVEYILSLNDSKILPLQGSYVTDKSAGRYLFTASYRDHGKDVFRPIEVTENIWLKPTVISADEFDQSKGVEARNGRIHRINNNSWVSYHDLDLTDIQDIKLKIGNNFSTTVISVRSGSTEGPELGRLTVNPSNETRFYTVDLKASNGKQDLYLLFERNQTENTRMIINSVELIPKL